VCCAGPYTGGPLGPNDPGPVRLRQLVRAVMERMDFDAIIIEGATRTSGARRGRVTIEVPKVGDPEIFEREMGELGIHAMRRETEPESAKALAVNSQR